MAVSICNRDALRAISPLALSAYARNAGWTQDTVYREHSDIYVGDTLPEVIVPRTAQLGDYASVVEALVKVFAQVADQDELSIYRSLVTADRDVIRVRAAESDDGSLRLDDGVDLVLGVRELVLAAACSLQDPRPVYRAGANQNAAELVQQMRLGQSEQGSYAISVLTPVLSPPLPELFEDPEDSNAPVARQTTKRLAEAVAAARRAAEKAGFSQGADFRETVANGVSANLCESLARLVKPFSALDIGVYWARTRPMKQPSTVIRFGQSDAALLKEASQALRGRAPKPDQRLIGFVRLLDRSEEDTRGTVRIKAEVDGQMRSVSAVLEQSDYDTAIQAHRDQAPVIVRGDLERKGLPWRLLNPRLERVLRDDEQDMA